MPTLSFVPRLRPIRVLLTLLLSIAPFGSCLCASAEALTVTNTNDSGAGSLRSAILSANAQSGGATIGFSPGLTGVVLLQSAEPDITTGVTIQGPGASALAVDGAGKFRVFHITAGQVSILGLTVQNGYFDTTTKGSQDYSTVGGGIAVEDGAVLALTDCTFKGNNSNRGGALFNYGNVTATGCTFSGNSASIPFGTMKLGAGGALWNGSFSSLVLIGCTLTGNHANEGGGGIYGGHVTLSDCSLTGNSTVYNGLSSSQGGGGISGVSQLTMTGCVLSGNTATGNGGGALSFGGTATITGCTFTANHALAGGALFAGTGQITLTDDILYGDTSDNNGSDPDEIFLYHAAVSSDHCDIQGGFAGTGNIDANPLFVSAPANLHLAGNSPCAGAGVPAANNSLDRDGNLRPYPPAIGAYDLSSSKPSSHVHLLWTHTSGQASVWTFSADGSHTVSPTFGPFPGWTAKALTAAPDGTQHLLWTNTSGAASLWNLAPNGSYTTSPTYGPYPGWSAVSLSTSPTTGQSRLLWTNTNGTASLWSIAPSGSYTLSPNFGPFAGWSAKFVASGYATVDLVWTNGSGQASGWKFAADGSHVVSPTYGPYSNWSATALSVGPDDGAHLLWDNLSGQIGVWSGDFGSGLFSEPSYGPFGGWSGRSLATGSDGVTHVLWSSTSGQASVWSFAGSGSPAGYTHGEYGPFAGWSAIALSAGP